MYPMWDEELATLRPAYSNSKWVSERSGIHYHIEAIDENKVVPVTAVRSDIASKSGHQRSASVGYHAI